MSSESDSPQETDSSEEGGDGDLSHLGAAQTKIKSFTVKQKSYQGVKRECGRLAQTVLGSSQSTSGEIVPTSGLHESAELHDLDVRSSTRVVQHNYYQVQQKFGDVTVQGTKNLTIGGTQNIGKPGPSQEEGKSQTLTEKIGERTTSRIEEWTRGMVKTSALAKVMERLNNGVKWITIKGSPGEGKTTLAYMALDELRKTGRQVFKVMTPEEFSEVTMTCTQPVIVLDDIFGNLEFDQAEWTKWKSVLFDVLGEKEHRSHEKETTSKEKEVTVILVGRDYVLNTASCDMGRISDFFTHDLHVIYMSKTIKRDLQEKRAIWEAISNASGVELDQKTVDTICEISSPHGFPHVCRMFVTLYQEDANINAEQFFKAPLEFLNQTVQKLMQATAKLFLFKEMVKNDGKVSVRDLVTADSSQDTKAVADSLVGTYLRKDDGGYIFDHPSIYDSVAFILCKRYPLFVIENCKLSFLHERLRLEPSSDTQQNPPSSESGLVVDISRCFLKDLAKRFAVEISNRNILQVLSHKVFTDEMFIKEIMSLSTLPLTQLLKLTDIKTRQMVLKDQNFLSLIASNKSPQLLKYIDNQTDIQLTQSEINTVLYGVCRYAASDVLTYLKQTRGSLDLNVRYEPYLNTPLMIAAGTRDSQFVHQIMSLNPDLNASDRLGTTVLHHLCENGLVSAVKEVIDRGIDIDVKNGNGWSPLLYACIFNHVEVAILLLDRGARMDASTVVWACRRGYMDVVLLMFERGATVDMTNLDTTLTAAIMGGHVNVMRFLIDKGASVNTVEESDKTPLHVACCWNKPQAVQCLVEHGVDRDRRDKHGNTPLYTAAERGCNECVDVLLKAGADVNVVNTGGNTPLHKAAGRGYSECVDVLLKAGADVDTTNIHGQTPLHTAVYLKEFLGLRLPDVSVCQTLITHKADVNKQNKEGNTPLHRLCQVDSHTDTLYSRLPVCSYRDVYRTLVTLLVDNGADVNINNNRGVPALHGWCQTLLSRNQRKTRTKRLPLNRGKTRTK